MNLRSALGETRYLALSSEDQAELARLQREVNATMRRIQAVHEAFTPAPEAAVK